MNLDALRKNCFDATLFPDAVLRWIKDKNYWNIWVPQAYGGLESSLTEGLTILKSLAKIDGSLGWTVTLCSGANYFIGNLNPEAANAIFTVENATCLGGSGAVMGTAEKIDDHYIVNGTWKYATGANYLSHFTLNASVYENASPVLDAEGAPVVRSFVIPKNQVTIIKDWNAMGLKASVTHSFKVEHVRVASKYSFKYNKQYLPQNIFKIPFDVFADLTLWVNYIGMAEHFYEEASAITSDLEESDLRNLIEESNEKLNEITQKVTDFSSNSVDFSTDFTEYIHSTAAQNVRQLSAEIIRCYPKLGIRACSEDRAINQVFKDFFTATQHHIFSK